MTSNYLVTCCSNEQEKFNPEYTKYTAHLALLLEHSSASVTTSQQETERSLDMIRQQHVDSSGQKQLLQGYSRHCL